MKSITVVYNPLSWDQPQFFFAHVQNTIPFFNIFQTKSGETSSHITRDHQHLNTTNNSCNSCILQIIAKWLFPTDFFLLCYFYTDFSISSSKDTLILNQRWLLNAFWGALTSTYVTKPPQGHCSFTRAFSIPLTETEPTPELRVLVETKNWSRPPTSLSQFLCYCKQHILQFWSETRQLTVRRTMVQISTGPGSGRSTSKLTPFVPPLSDWNGLSLTAINVFKEQLGVALSALGCVTRWALGTG